MGSILKINEVSKLNNLKGNKKTVLVGGCFDIVHPGHLLFLEKAKRVGNYLIVLLENDEKIKQTKGINRPVHNQSERAKVLANLTMVDYIVMLPFMDTEKQYDELIEKIKPDVIATTKGLADNHHKIRAAKLSGAKLKYVTSLIGDYSTSSLIRNKDL